MALGLGLAACGGGGGGSSPPPPPPTFNISGTVSGLQGQDLVLGFNGSANIVLHANGLFTGPQFPQGTAYTVVVLDQPQNPWQTCTVTNGTGTLTGPVNNVAVACTTNKYHLSFTVAGLSGANFALQLNGGAAEPVPVTSSGAFSFSADLASGTNYTIAITTQPDGQVCTIANPTGQVAGANINNVSITCTTEAFSYIVRDLFLTLDLAYNPASGELYVSTDSPATGPSITVVDPRNGNTLRTVPTTDRAAPLAISEDGQFLYAGLAATGRIRRYALPALTSDLEFSAGTDHVGGSLEPYDIRVAPGNARTIAVTRAYKNVIPTDHGLAVFDDGVARPDSIGGATPAAGVHPDGALWSPDGTKIYSLGDFTSSPRYYQAAVSATGVTLQDEIPLPQERSYGFGVIDLHFANRNYQMAGDRLYSATGTVFDPARRAQVGAFRTQGQGLAIDTARNKAFFASGGFLLPVTFESFNLARMTPIASHTAMVPPQAAGLVEKLVRWGTDGLAAITSKAHLIIVRGAFVSDTAGLVPVGNLVESTGSAGAYQYRVYNLPANDVLWDAARERLYAAVNGQHRAFGNSIASINVNLNQVVASAAAGSEPTWMSASDDGTRMYVTHYASSSVVRVDLTTMLLNTVFLLNYPGQGPGYALAAEARPGDASTFAYIEHYPAVSAVFTRMISNLTLRPQSFDEPISTMAFVNANTLFGNNTGGSTLDLYEIGVVPTGLQQVRYDPNIFNGQPRMTSAGGLLYGDGGFSIDPVTRNIVHTYNPGIGGTPKAFRANPTRDRGYLAFVDSGSVAHLMVFRLSDETLLATVPLPANLQSPISLASMGTNGVAITTTAGKTVIVQGPDL